MHRLAASNDVVSIRADRHAVKARLDEHGVKAPEDQVRRVVEAIKDKTEAHTKEQSREFICYYRDWDENHKGVNTQESWEICQQAGIDVPSKVDGKQKVKA